MSKWDDPDNRAIALGDGSYEDRARKLRDKNPGVDFTSEAVRLFVRRNSNTITGKWTEIKSHLDYLYDKFFGIDKVLIASDFEFPYQDNEFCQQALDDAISNNCKMAILGGDILHSASYSPYTIDTSISFQKDELGQAVDFVSELTKYMDVILVSGNHDRRLKRYVSKNINVGDIDLLLGDSLDPLSYIAKETGAINTGWWWVHINDMIIAHPNRYSSGGIKNIINSINYFTPRVNKPLNCMVQGHSHQINKGVYNGMHYIETGCMCNLIDFNVGPNQTQPIWHQGYAIAKFDDAVYNTNESKLIFGRKLL